MFSATDSCGCSTQDCSSHHQHTTRHHEAHRGASSLLAASGTGTVSLITSGVRQWVKHLVPVAVSSMVPEKCQLYLTHFDFVPVLTWFSVGLRYRASYNMANESQQQYTRGRKCNNTLRTAASSQQFLSVTGLQANTGRNVWLCVVSAPVENWVHSKNGNRKYLMSW